MKRPSFQFYPADWLRDTGLRLCSTGARGLWIDMICYMHEGNPYGYLKVANKVILPENLARMVGETLDVVEGWLAELREAGVYDIDEDGSICSRRMIRDEEVRQARAAGGKLGGNPALIDKSKVDERLTLEVKQKPTPSSSSSSSSSNKKTYDAQAHLVSLGVDKKIASDWLKTRKVKKLAPTETAIESVINEAKATGKSLNDVIKICCEQGWGGFKASWLDNLPAANGPTTAEQIALMEAKEAARRAAAAPTGPTMFETMKARKGAAA